MSEQDNLSTAVTQLEDTTKKALTDIASEIAGLEGQSIAPGTLQAFADRINAVSAAVTAADPPAPAAPAAS